MLCKKDYVPDLSALWLQQTCHMLPGPHPYLYNFN
jgi:hypothetical protein